MVQWYCYIQRQQYGPVDEPTIRQWIREGRILPENMVWNSQLPDWTPAGDVPGLFGAGASTVSSQPTPIGAPGTGAGSARPAPAMEKSHNAGLALGLSIAGWVTCCFFIDVFALILASKEIQDIDAGRKDPSGRGLAKAAQVISIIHLVLQGGFILLSLIGGIA